MPIPCHDPAGTQECNYTNYRDYTNPDFIAGNIFYSGNSVNLGGGISVSEIEIEKLNGYSKTSYDYEGGTTSYEPLGLDQADINYPSTSYYSDEGEDYSTKAYKKKLYEKFSQLLANSREIPPPGVMYEYVSIRDSVNGNVLPQHSRYQFEVFNQDDIGIENLSDTVMEYASTSSYAGISYKRLKKRDLAIKDFTSRVGSLKRITLYENEHGGIINETINHYLHDDLTGSTFEEKAANYEGGLHIFKSQGVIQETLMDSRFVKEKDETQSLLGIVSRKHYYPTIQTGQTTINYKTGITTTTQNLAFDFYSGQVVKTMSTDGYGNSYISERTPAYRVYSTMGVSATGGYNMLTQEASSYTYKIDPANNDTKVGLVSAGVQTWSGEVDVLDHTELHRSMPFESISPKDASGYYSAFVSLPHRLEIGDRFKFSYAGNTYYGKVISAEPFSAGGTQGYYYQLQLIDKQLGISSEIDNITCKVLTVNRKYASFSYIGDDNVLLRSDGLHTLTNNQLPQFTAWNQGDATSVNWQKNGEITLYDVHSHALEASDVNSQYAATKMSTSQTQVYSTVANAKYDEFAYSGVEDKSEANNLLGGGVSHGGTAITTSAHTGKYAIQAQPDQKAFGYTANPLQRTYHVSVWSSNPFASIKFKRDNEVTEQLAAATKKGTAGAWHLLEADILLSADYSTLDVWCEAVVDNQLFDDFRFHPVDAAMTSYVYNTWGELSHILDNNNLFTEYRYDGMGRLKETFKETLHNVYGNQGIVKVSEVNYNYGRDYNQSIMLTASKSGPTGQIFPSGNVQAQLGGTINFQLVENCLSHPVLQNIIIDGQSYGTSTRTVTLPGGTHANLSRTAISLQNVTAMHSILAVFGENPPVEGAPGVVTCETTTNGCYTGQYRYGYYDACGDITQWETSFNMPSDLAPYYEGLTCTNPPDSNCPQQ